MRIAVKLNTYLITAFVVLSIGIGIAVVSSQKNRILESTEESFNSQIEDIFNMVDIQISDNQKVVDISMNLANEYFYNQGDLRLNGKYIQFDAMNQITKKTHSISIPQWEIDGKIIQRSTEIVDAIKNKSVQTVTIFQKIPKGFLRISTNVMKLNGQRAVGTFIPNNSPVIQTVLKGQTYRGRAYVVNDWYLTAYEPILINGEIEGILYVGVKEKNLENLSKIFNQKRISENGYAALVSNDGGFIIPPPNQKGFGNITFLEEIRKTGQLNGKIHINHNGEDLICYFSYFDPINAYVTLIAFEKDLLKETKEIIVAGILIGLIGIAIFVLVITLLTRSITNALHKGVRFSKEISEGNLQTELMVNQKDEIGVLADSLKLMSEKLNEIMKKISQEADKISETSSEINQASIKISEDASEQASSTEEFSATIQEMMSSIQQTTESARQTETIALNAASDIENGNKMTEIAEDAMKDIASKIKIVSDIAAKTNMLALNAAVEAARAGEHGKGFAVVATEIKKLAEQSRIAAQEIESLTANGVKLQEDSRVKLSEIVPEIGKTSKLVQEIVHYSAQQEIGGSQVNASIKELSQIAQQNAGFADMLANNAEQLSVQANELFQLIKFFKTR